MADFTLAEAQQLVGQRVRCKFDFPAIPKDSTGRVILAQPTLEPGSELIVVMIDFDGLRSVRSNPSDTHYTRVPIGRHEFTKDEWDHSIELLPVRAVA